MPEYESETKCNTILPTESEYLKNIMTKPHAEIVKLATGPRVVFLYPVERSIDIVVGAAWCRRITTMPALALLQPMALERC
jgi:hypothetical protein